MSNTTDITSSFAQQVIQAAQDGADAMFPEEQRKARQLCGREFWDNLSTPERIQAGSILAEAVKQRLLPLAKGDRSTNNHQRYRRL